MLRFFLESAVLYALAKLGLRLGLFTRAELREFGLFVGVLAVLFLLSRVAEPLFARLSAEKTSARGEHFGAKNLHLW